MSVPRITVILESLFGTGLGTAILGKFGIDQVTPNANEVVTKTGSKTSLEAGSAIAGKFGIDQTTDETTNLVRVKGIALSNYATAALAASGIPKATPGVLHSISVTNTSASAQYFQLFDSATLPANGTVPLFSVLLQAGGFGFFDWPVYGKAFAAGIVWCNSSTHATKTIGSADCFVTATFK